METCLAQNSATTTLNQTPLHIQKLLDTKPCPVKFPTFAGLANEDFVIFRDRFTTAAQARGISRIDQVDKLRDMLTGKALAYLPKEGIGDIDVAWEYLSQVYGNSHTILNFHLAKLVGMPGMTDEIMETNPQDAADWLLDMEILVDSILRVGVRSQELQWLTFSRETMFHCIISKLPYRLLDRTYELDTQGEEKLRQVLQLIRRARANAQARATDITTDKILSSTDMTLPPSSRSPETGHMMGTSSLPARATTTSTSSLPPSFYQSSSDTYLSPTPLPCITDTEIPSLFSTPYTPRVRTLCCLHHTRSSCPQKTLLPPPTSGPWQLLLQPKGQLLRLMPGKLLLRQMLFQPRRLLMRRPWPCAPSPLSLARITWLLRASSLLSTLSFWRAPTWKL